jgi:hypothetical protein
MAVYKTLIFSTPFHSTRVCEWGHRRPRQEGQMDCYFWFLLSSHSCFGLVCFDRIVWYKQNSTRSYSSEEKIIKSSGTRGPREAWREPS